MSTNKDKYNAKYGYPKGTSHSKKDISKNTGIPVRILDEIYDRASAARRNNPSSVRRATDGKKVGGKSLKGKMSANAWSFGRIYSFVMKQPGTWGRADKDIASEVKKLKIKGYMR
tara:strand:+ start:599 stop:943 length:345 start_codon:yes stop_codon:yes gene_type:complete